MTGQDLIKLISDNDRLKYCDVKETIKELENQNYSTQNISKIILKYGYNSEVLDVTKEFYYKSFDYLVEKNEYDFSLLNDIY